MFKHCCVHYKYFLLLFFLEEEAWLSSVTRNKVSQDIKFQKKGEERNVVYNHNVNTRKGVQYNLKNSVVDTCLLLMQYNTTIGATTVSLKMESTWSRAECTLLSTLTFCESNSLYCHGERPEGNLNVLYKLHYNRDRNVQILIKMKVLKISIHNIMFSLHNF